jgi:Asp-tRNA(Asn)/Glu-tRNA(Gln) amidotransferase A subunit family amidase
MSITPQQFAQMEAADVARRLSAGEFAVTDYASALLHRIQDTEPNVQAWETLSADYAMAQAHRLDEAHATGEPDGPLFGVPVGLKDVIDTRDLPTGDGTVLHAGRTPAHDAALVWRLRNAGAWVMGKTVTTEMATYTPGKTRNPHHPEHTPGGSSSGSAAAVAAGHVPLAVGTQTNGSVIRPASFCGVVGYKPSFGMIPRTGVLRQSPSLDQVGVFGRSVGDVALLAQALTGFDEQDPATRVRAMPPLYATAMQEPPLPPSLAWVATPFWSRVESDAQQAFEALVAALGPRIKPFALPESSAEVVAWHQALMEADIACSYAADHERGRDRMSASLRAQIERGQQVSAVQYRQAQERIEVINQGFEAVFENFDALLTPATLGTAPRGLESTGDPLMCTLWTYAGMPAITLPLLQGANGLPLGVQLVGQRGDDARLLRTARWLMANVADMA